MDTNLVDLGTMSASRIPHYLLLVGLAITPFLFIPSAIIPFVFLKTHLLTVLVSVAFLIAVVTALKRRSVSLTFHPILISLWLVVAAYIVSALFSPTPKLSLIGIRFDVDTAAFMFIAAFAATLSAHLLADRKSLSQVLRWSSIALSVMAVYVAARFMLGADFLSFGFFTDKTSNFVGSWNDVALIAGLASIIILNSLRQNVSVGKRVALIAGLVVSLFFLAITNYFTALLTVAIVAAGLYLLEFLATIRARSALPLLRLYPMLVLLTAIVAGVFAFETGIGGKLADSAGISRIEARPSWGTTFAIGQGVLKESPLFGSGPNTFVKDWLANKPTEVNATVFWNADFIQGVGTIPTAFITVGSVGMVTFGIFLLLLVLAAIQFFAKRNSVEGGYYSSTFGLAALYLVLFTFVYTPAPIIVLLAYASVGLFIASLIAEGFIAKREISLAMPTWGSYLVQIGMALSIIAVIGYVVQNATRFIASVEAARASVAFQSGDLTGGMRHSAIATSLAHVDEYQRLSSLGNLLVLRELVNKADPTEENKVQAQQELSEAIAHAQQATLYDGTNYQNWLALAQVYIAVLPLRVDGAYQNAKESLTKAIALSPKNPDLELTFAQLELGQSNNAEGRKHLTNALSLKNDFTSAIYLLAQLDIAEGKSDEALQALAVVQQLIPNEPSIYFMAGYLFYQQNNDKDAVAALSQAVALNKEYANAHYFLGLALARSGSTEAAVKEFEGLASTNPDNTDVAAILANLKAGKQPFATGAQKPTKTSPLPIKGE